MSEPALGKAWALLLVLARRGAWVPRSELVYLFWPDQDESHARANLRKLLSRNVAALPFAGGVEAEPNRLRWRVASDVEDFERALEAGRLDRAVELYGGPFLDGVRADGLPEFESWVEGEREALAAAWRNAATTLAAQATAGGRTDDAVRVLAALRDADPLDEEALQAYLRALSAAGRQASGLAAYRAFAERLEREIGETPSLETRALAAPLRLAPSAPRTAPPSEAPGGGGTALPAAALAQLDLERDEMTAALRTAVLRRDLEAIERTATALEPHFAERSRYREGVALYEEAADALGEDDDPAHSRTTAGLRVRAGWLECRRGRFDRAEELADRARRGVDTARGHRVAVEHEALLGALARSRGDTDRAWDHFDRALALARASDRPSQVAVVLAQLGTTERQLALFRQAEARYREALAIHRSRSDALGAARTLDELGALLLADGRLDEATAILEEGLTLARAAAAQGVLPHVLGGLARSALAQGDAAAAIALADEAWQVLRATGARGSGSGALVTLALAAATEGDDRSAEGALEAAVLDARETGSRAATLAALGGIGRVRALRGDHRGAAMALALVREDPELEQSARRELSPAWRACVGALGTDAVAAAQAEAEAVGVDGMLARLVPSAARGRGPSR